MKTENAREFSVSPKRASKGGCALGWIRDHHQLSSQNTNPAFVQGLSSGALGGSLGNSLLRKQ
jgi:hypothetical protein